MESQITNNFALLENKDNLIYDNYDRSCILQQTNTDYLSNSYSLSNNYMYNGQNQSVYNLMYNTQNVYRNQNTYDCNWSADDKIQTNYNNSVNCVDNNLYYNKNNYVDSQWLYNTNFDKYTEFPSCSQQQFNNQPDYFINEPACMYSYSEDKKIDEVESDIVVEESDDEVTDESEDEFTSKCIICCVSDINLYPVDCCNKLQNLGLKLKTNVMYRLCNSCLSAINTLTALEIQLKCIKDDLLNKVNKNYKHLTSKRKKRWRNVCGIHGFTCRFCHKSFTLQKLHKQHMSKHNKSLCEFCGIRFSRKSTLNLHLRRKHCKQMKKINPKPQCPICKRVFVKQSDCQTHLKSHSSERRFRCSSCPKSFKTLSNLNQHAKIHSEVAQLRCSVCNKGFTRKDTLQTHINTVHQGIKPFICSKCGKQFASSKNKTAHERLHFNSSTSHDKLQCPVCGKKLRRLADHMRSHAAVRNIPCEKCSMVFVTKAALTKHTQRKHQQKLIQIKQVSINNQQLPET